MSPIPKAISSGIEAIPSTIPKASSGGIEAIPIEAIPHTRPATAMPSFFGPDTWT
jgi:hypothetical protein